MTRISRQQPTANSQQLSTPWKRSFRTKLLAWYADHARDLPWRNNRDPYRVWLSEVMLQQTTVAAVKPYFERFTTAFPTVESLANADEADVLRLWEGLGYYRRARGLHAAAKQIVAEHNGQVPRDVPTLQTLPGIGRYTAGAIVSIAFDQRAPILEANTIRVFTRLTAYRGDPVKSAGQKFLWSVAEEVLPQRDIARFNQALMELGSLVCTPTAPNCGACPVNTLCEARRAGAVDELAATTKKLKFESVSEVAVIVRKGTKILVRQCGPTERWSGLWDFPRFECDSAKQIAAKLISQTGVTAELGEVLTSFKYGVTRFRISLDCYTAKHRSGRLAGPHLAWRTAEEIAALPLSVTGRRIAKLLEKKRIERE